MAANWVRRHSGFVVLALAFGLGACSTETVLVDKPTYNPPPDSVGGFLGYYTAGTNQTTCGNCHVGQQQDWSQTVHSGAWADAAQASEASQASVRGATASTRAATSPSPRSATTRSRAISITTCSARTATARASTT